MYYCMSCSHRKKGFCELGCKGAKTQIVNGSPIVVACDNFDKEKPGNILSIHLTGSDYFYVRTKEKTVKAALDSFKEKLKETGLDLFGSEYVITSAVLMTGEFKRLDELTSVPKKPCVPVGNCKRCVNIFGTFGCWSTVSNIKQYDCEEGQRLFEETQRGRIDPKRVKFDEVVTINGETSYYFDYPKEYLHILEKMGMRFSYNGYDPKTVESCCIKVSYMNTLDTISVEISPTVHEVDDNTDTITDIDFMPLEEGTHYILGDIIQMLMATAIEERK